MEVSLIVYWNGLLFMHFSSGKNTPDVHHDSGKNVPDMEIA